MVERLEGAREAVRRASDVADDATVRKQLRSIDEGLMELTERGATVDDTAKTEGDVPHGDELEEIEAKLTGLVDETAGATRRHLEDARNAIDAYRVAYTRDW